METNGGPMKPEPDEQTIPLQKYKTTLYMNSDDPPEKLQPSGPVRMTLGRGEEGTNAWNGCLE